MVTELHPDGKRRPRIGTQNLAFELISHIISGILFTHFDFQSFPLDLLVVIALSHVSLQYLYL